MNNDKEDKKEKILSKKDIFFILLAFLIIVIFYFLPTPAGLPFSGKLMIGILLMAAILWITEPIPLPVTGLLIMILQPLLGLMQPKDVFSSFGNQAVFFLIGAFIIAAAIEKHGLHKRIALKFLSYFESSPRFFTFGIMCSCAFLSFVMPEHGVAALFLPIITSILIAMKIVPKQSNFGKISMLSVAYGCSIGSLGTLIGGARNPLAIGLLAEEGITVTFLDWMIYSMPVVFIALPLVWLILQFSFPIEIKDIALAKKVISNQVIKAGKLGINQIKVIVIFMLTLCLWVFFSQYMYFGLAVIALLGGVLLFMTGCLSWKDVERRVPWGIILLYGGAITLGMGIIQTGAADWIAKALFYVIGENPYLVILGLIVVTIFLTEIMSNTGAVAILLPVGFSISTAVSGISPLLSAMLIALSGGLAFMLVIATPGNAITYSSGYFTTKDLFKTGVLANIVCITIVFSVAIFYWKGVLGL
jgi:solute carrier family 13 (sodium-dependent dicarboxylate transporter), member 2/3/5